MLARTERPSPGPLARAFERFRLNGAALCGLCIALPMLVFILSYPLWWRFQPNDIDLLAMNAAPNATHWFGTDGVGRDVFARVLEGGRISLMVAAGSTLISALIGFLFGSISAFAGRWADALSMRFVDLVPAAGDLPAGARLHHGDRHLADDHGHIAAVLAAACAHGAFKAAGAARA